MALNENMNEEQDMPVQQQEEVTLPQPLSKEEEEKMRAGEIPDFPEEVPTELVEEVAKGVEDALDAQAQEPERDLAQEMADALVGDPRLDPRVIEDLISYAEGRVPFRERLAAEGIVVEDRPGLLKPRQDQDLGPLQERHDKLVAELNARIGRKPPQLAGYSDPVPTREQVLSGFASPTEAFWDTVPEEEKGELKRMLGEEPEINYDFSDPQSKVSVFFNTGYVDDMVNSQGYVVGTGAVVQNLIREDRKIAEENGIDFSFSKAYLGSMADLYIDAMKRIGKDVSKLNPDSPRFQKYAASKEGAREIDQALTIIHYHNQHNGDVPSNIRKRFNFPEGKGRLDSRYIGLTDQDYENMGLLGKIGYNFAVAGKTVGDTAIPFFEDITGEVTPGVAPIGELAGTMAGWLAPFSAANKFMAGKNILQGAKYGNIPGWAVRNAVAGVAADTYVFDTDEGTMANMFAEKDSILINNAFTTALAIDIDDPEWEAKAKIALEGVVVGGMLDKTVSVLKKIKKGDNTGGLFPRRRIKFGADGEVEEVTSGLNPELDKALLDLEESIVDAEKRIKEAEAEALALPQDSPKESYDILQQKRKAAQEEVSRIGAVVRALREGVISEEDAPIVEAFIAGVKKQLREAKALDLPTKEEVVERKVLSDVVDDFLKEDAVTVRKEGPLIDWQILSDIIKDLKEGKGLVEEVAKFKIDIEGIFEDTVSEFLKSPDKITHDDALELFQIAAFLRKQDPSLKSDVRLALAYDVLEDVRTPKGSRRKRLVPADRGTNLFNLSKMEKVLMDGVEQDGILSEIELKEILSNRARSNKLSPDGAAKFSDQVNKHGIDAASRPVAARAAKGAVDIAVDVRTNNLLYSLGVPALAAAGGALVKTFRAVEFPIGSTLQKMFGLRGTPAQRRLIKSTKERIKTLEATLGEEPDAATVKKIRDLKIQLSQIDRTPKRVKEEIEILREIEELDKARDTEFGEFEVDPDVLENLRNKARDMGLIVEDPRLRKEAQEQWDKVTDLRREREKWISDNFEMRPPFTDVALLRRFSDERVDFSELLALDEKIEIELKLAKEKTALVPREKPTRISDLEDELQALEDPTYRGVKTGEYTFDNIFYTLSGGKVQLAGRDPEPKDLVDLIKGLLSASAPSRIDPSIATKSETLLGAGLKAGYDDVLGIDPAGLSRLGKLAQGIDDPAMRNLATTLVSVLEFIPRKGLAALDEGMKTRDFIREFLIRIDENIKSLDMPTVAVGVATKEQQEIADIIKEAMMGALGTKGDAIDFVEVVMEEVAARTLSPGLSGKSKEALRTGEVGPYSGPRQQVLEEAGLEQDVLLLDMLSKLNLSDGAKKGVAEILDGVEKFTKERRLTAEQLPQIRKVVERTVEEAQQYARETTITQDVPPMLESFVKGMQKSAILRAISPFTRALTNVGVMAFARVPGLNLLIRKERQALSGALGEVDQARSIGKLAVGSGLITTGWYLTDPDREGIRLEVVDKGSWKEYNLVIPKSADKFAEEVEAAALRWYMNNSEIIDRELEREGLEITQANAIDYITSNLPEWEDRAGYVKVNFSRLGPYNTLIEMGMMLRDAQEKAPWEYMTEKEEENSPVWDIVTQTFDFVSNQGWLSPANDFFKMFDNPDYAATAFVNGWGADLISPFKGLRSTAGEPGQLDFRPSRGEDMWTQKRFNQILAQDPSTLMKKRDFLGRVIDAPDRILHLLGKKEDLDLINAEMEEMGFRKRVPRPTEVTKFSGIDLRKFNLKKNLTKEQKELLSTVVVATDGQNAYEDFLIMSGSINVVENEFSEIKGSAINGLQEYFKSQEYKTLKDTIVSLDEDSSPDEKYEAEVAYDEIRKRVNQWISMGRDKAALALWDMADMYINEDGDSLRDIYLDTSEKKERAESQVFQRLQGLDALRSGGNK